VGEAVRSVVGLQMRASQDSKTSRRTPVTLVLSEQEQVPQPDSFRVCALGVQFYSPRPFPEFEVLDFVIRIPDGNKRPENVGCTGVVVHCRKSELADAGKYRIWVKFLDLPETKIKRLKCISRLARLQCPYCENF
jgi:hypothetical protein